MKVKKMNRFLAKALQTVRKSLTADAETTRMLENTHVQVVLSSRLWSV